LDSISAGRQGETKTTKKFRGVYKVIEKEYNLLVKIFEKYYDSYEEMLYQVKDVESDTVIWSDSFLEFFHIKMH